MRVVLIVDGFRRGGVGPQAVVAAFAVKAADQAVLGLRNSSENVRQPVCSSRYDWFPI